MLFARPPTLCLVVAPLAVEPLQTERRSLTQIVYGFKAWLVLKDAIDCVCSGRLWQNPPSSPARPHKLDGSLTLIAYGVKAWLVLEDTIDCV